MFNLLVTWKEGAFDALAYELERGRFGEYTTDKLVRKYGPLKPAAISKLQTIPTLFVYESLLGDARVGYFKRIRERNGNVLVEFEFDGQLQPFPASALDALRIRLDINRAEFTRTHWAIKDEDLLSVLSSSGLIGISKSPAAIENMHFKVALSFPGENRDYVSQVAEILKSQLAKGSVFYDNDFTAQLARPNLDTLLQRVYGEQSDLVVVFLSVDYERKQWCGLEWRAVREIIKNRRDHAVMFMRFDDAIVPGTLSIDGYVDLRGRSPAETASLIEERVRIHDQGPAVRSPWSTEVFRLKDGEQTTYINLLRIYQMLAGKGFSTEEFPPTNKPLLDGDFPSAVSRLERILKTLKIEAVPIAQIRNAAQCEEVVGKLIAFRGRFRSSNAPRLKRSGEVPVYHSTGEIDKDHTIRKTFGEVELVLPLDSFWYASHSSVGFFRSKGLAAIHGIARVQSSEGLRLIASPVWMTLPNEPIFD